LDQRFGDALSLLANQQSVQDLMRPK